MGKIRVIQYGVGPIGAGMVRLMLTKPAIQIVSAIDVDPQKVGKDLGLVAGAERAIGVRSTPTARPCCASAPTSSSTTLSDLKSVAGQLIACLGARLHVVSTCEELSYPYRKHPDLCRAARRTAAQARRRRARSAPASIPASCSTSSSSTLAAACAARGRTPKPSSHRGRHRSAASRLQAKIGAGMTPDEFQRAGRRRASSSTTACPSRSPWSPTDSAWRSQRSKRSSSR